MPYIAGAGGCLTMPPGPRKMRGSCCAPLVMVRLTSKGPQKGHSDGPSGHDPEPTRNHRNQPGTWNKPGTNPAKPGCFQVGSGLVPGWFQVVPGWFRVMAGGPEIVAHKWPLARQLDQHKAPLATDPMVAQKKISFPNGFREVRANGVVRRHPVFFRMQNRRSLDVATTRVATI